MELWGTFSVTDHRRRRAFIADVLLYDRLAIPIPDGVDEWNRWERSGRDPERQPGFERRPLLFGALSIE